MNRIVIKIDSGATQPENIDAIAKQFTLIWTKPHKNSISFFLSSNKLQKTEKSHVINWMRSDADFETRIKTETQNWVLEIDARCSTAETVCSKPVHVESDTFDSFGLKMNRLKALCWKIELVLEIGPYLPVLPILTIHLFKVCWIKPQTIWVQSRSIEKRLLWPKSTWSWTFKCLKKLQILAGPWPLSYWTLSRRFVG